MNIPEKVTFGEHYFSTAILLCESLFLSSMLSIANVREGLHKNINKFGRIFHGGLTPPLPLRWKIIKKKFLLNNVFNRVLTL